MKKEQSAFGSLLLRPVSRFFSPCGGSGPKIQSGIIHSRHSETPLFSLWDHFCSVIMAGAEGLGLACRLGRLVEYVPLARTRPSARGFGVDVGKASRNIREQDFGGAKPFLSANNTSTGTLMLY